MHNWPQTGVFSSSTEQPGQLLAPVLFTWPNGVFRDIFVAAAECATEPAMNIASKNITKIRAKLLMSSTVVPSLNAVQRRIIEFTHFPYLLSIMRKQELRTVTERTVSRLKGIEIRRDDSASGTKSTSAPGSKPTSSSFLERSAFGATAGHMLGQSTFR